MQCRTNIREGHGTLQAPAGEYGHFSLIYIIINKIEATEK